MVLAPVKQRAGAADVRKHSDTKMDAACFLPFRRSMMILMYVSRRMFLEANRRNTDAVVHTR